MLSVCILGLVLSAKYFGSSGSYRDKNLVGINLILVITYKERNSIMTLLRKQLID